MVFLEAYKKNLKMWAMIWGGAVVLFALIYVLVLGQQSHSKKKLEKELEEKRQLFEFAQNAAHEDTRKRLLEQIEKLRNNLDVFTIDFEDSANLTFDISQIAREKNVASLNVENRNKLNSLEEPDSKNITENHINISFVTGFNQFAAFLNALERHQPVLFVNEFKLVRSNKNISTYNVTMDVAALIKRQQDKETTANSLQQVSDKSI
jgi:Tfp pilus assembly protein PilO